MLAERGLPCPEPIGSGPLFGGPLIKGSMLILEYLSDALPPRSVLSQGGAPPGPVLDGLVTLLCTLREQGGVHEDLQWNNIMVRSTPHGLQLYLIDALHLRWAHGSGEAPFRKTLVWFLYFLLQDNAPQVIVDGFIVLESTARRRGKRSSTRRAVSRGCRRREVPKWFFRLERG